MNEARIPQMCDKRSIATRDKIEAAIKLWCKVRKLWPSGPEIAAMTDYSQSTVCYHRAALLRTSRLAECEHLIPKQLTERQG